MTLLSTIERPRVVSSDVGALSLDMTGLKALSFALQNYTERGHLLPGLDETASRCKEVMAANLDAVAATVCRETVEADFGQYKPDPPDFYFMTPEERARIDLRDATHTYRFNKFLYEASISKEDLWIAFSGPVDSNYKPIPALLSRGGDPTRRAENLQNATGQQTGVDYIVSRREVLLEYIDNMDALFPKYQGEIDEVKDDIALRTTIFPDTNDAPPEVLEHRLKLANKNFHVTLPTWTERRVAAIALRQYARRTDGPSRVLAIDALEQLSSNKLSAFLEKTLVYTGMPVIKAASFLSRVIGRSRAATVA